VIKYQSLKDFFDAQQPDVDLICDDWAILNSNKFPIKGINTEGAILFADLPGYSKMAKQLTPEECLYVINHFFTWIEAEAIQILGGIVDKFIGDEIMIVFPSQCYDSPLERALRVARMILDYDPIDFAPRIGIACGKFIIAEVGTQQRKDVSAIGHAVNVASRCVGSILARHSLKVATLERELVERIFGDKTTWEVFGPIKEELKNISVIDTVYVRRKTEWVPQFNYLEEVRKIIATAKMKKIQGSVGGT